MNLKNILGLAGKKDEISSLNEDITILSKEEDVKKVHDNEKDLVNFDKLNEEKGLDLSNLDFQSSNESLNNKNPFFSLKKKMDENEVSMLTTNTIDEDFFSSPEIITPTEEKKQLVEEKQKPLVSVIKEKKVVKSKSDDFSKINEKEHDESNNALKKLERRSYTHTSDIFSEGLELNQKRLPIIGDFPINKQYKIVAGLAAFCFAGMILGVFLYGSANSKENKAIQLGTELSSDIQKINTFFSESVIGKPQSYEKLVNVTAKARADFNLLKEYGNSVSANLGLMTLQSKIDGDLNSINRNIDVLRLQSDLLMNSSQKVNEFSKNVIQLNNDIDKFINIYVQQSLNQNELANVYSLKTNLQAINGTLATILLSNKIDPIYIEMLNKARQDFKTSLISLQVGNAARGINPINSNVLNNAYQDIGKNWVKLSAQADLVTNKSNELIQVRNLTPQNELFVSSVLATTQNILSLYKNEDLTGVKLSEEIILISLILLIITIAITFYIYTFEKDNRGLFEKVENNKNQSSILKLLNEMMPLQDGNLTKKTTVTEEITGAIADSINATIDSLASLVKKIKDTSFIMREKTNEVNLISLEMLKTTENQASSLNDTGSSVIKIANAITEISIQTDKGSEEARKSVSVSEEGAKQVQDSVKSMREINNNMIETVYLMDKVGNSSKQISEIVELLSDITEETSILALNATVQAAKAGDAGKGFKIVADSIQELADKAADAARRVGALISAVQTDINAVSNAVQKTTEEVDKGVKLSELAGESLNKMTVVSKELSKIVASISEDAKSHAESAKKVSESMKEILKTTEENKLSTEKTAASISEISEISNELGESVQSFKVD